MLNLLVDGLAPEAVAGNALHEGQVAGSAAVLRLEEGPPSARPRADAWRMGATQCPR
jgi:hypothetical protein